MKIHNLLQQVMPVNQAIMIFIIGVNAYSNIFLYRFLKKVTAKNTAIKETDKEISKTWSTNACFILLQKRDRKRNLMPAQIGIVVLVIFVVGFSILTLVLSNFRKSFWSSHFDLVSLDWTFRRWSWSSLIVYVAVYYQAYLVNFKLYCFDTLVLRSY